MREKLLGLAVLILTISHLGAQTTWSAKIPINTNTGNAPFTIASGLVDGDSKPDIIVGTNTSNTIEVYINTSTGPDDISFAAPVLVTNSLSAIGGLALIDLDGINGPDIVATAYTNDILAWYPNNGSGGFPTENIISNTVLGASGLSFGTIDAGPTIDIAVTAYDAGSVLWFANDGSGNFTGPNVIDNTLPAPGSVNLKDIDSDGDLDALITTAQFAGNVDIIEIFENNLVPGGSVSFTDPDTMSSVENSLNYIFNARFEDLDGDMNLDILATELHVSPGLGNFYWYEDTNTDPLDGSAFTRTAITTTIGNPSVAMHMDLDFDGDKDIVLSSGSPNAGTDLAWFINDGAGNYSSENIIDATQSQAYVYTVADFDGDNDVDIASAAFNQNDLNAFRNEKFVLSVDQPGFEEIKLYPNPSDHSIFLRGIQQAYDVDIFNLLGQEVLNGTIEPGTALDIRTLKRGVYLMRLNELNYTFKFVKN